MRDGLGTLFSMLEVIRRRRLREFSSNYPQCDACTALARNDDFLRRLYATTPNPLNAQVALTVECDEYFYNSYLPNTRSVANWNFPQLSIVRHAVSQANVANISIEGHIGSPIGDSCGRRTR
jgi:hypothetical protein